MYFDVILNVCVQWAFSQSSFFLCFMQLLIQRKSLMWVAGSGFYWRCSFKMYEVKLPIIDVIVLIMFPVSLQSMGPNSLMFVRNLLDKLGSNQQNILKFIACNEIFLMPATVFMLFRYNLFFINIFMSCWSEYFDISNQCEQLNCDHWQYSEKYWS